MTITLIIIHNLFVNSPLPKIHLINSLTSSVATFSVICCHLLELLFHIIYVAFLSEPSGLYAGHLYPTHFLFVDHLSCVNAYGMIFPKGLDFFLIF